LRGHIPDFSEKDGGEVNRLCRYIRVSAATAIEPVSKIFGDRVDIALDSLFLVVWHGEVVAEAAASDEAV